MNGPPGGGVDALEDEAVAAVRHALAVVREHRLAEVEITLSSDRAGAVHMRQVARLPLAALAEKQGGPDGY